MNTFIIGRWWAIAVGITLAVSGCFSPKFDEGKIACGPNDACPPGLTCAEDKVCRVAGKPAPDASSGQDADITAPEIPTLTSVMPGSPANDNTPILQGVAEPGTTVTIFSGGCTTMVASGTAAQFASPGIVVPVLDDTTSQFRATAKDAAGNASSCSSSITYIEDSTAPAAPHIVDTVPSSPSRSTMPKVRGTAEASSTVTIFANGTCAGAPIATGLADATGAFAIDITVTLGSSTSLSASGHDAANNAAPCSGLGVAYQQDSSAVSPPTFTSTIPASPSNASNTPSIVGTTEANVAVRLYTDANCASTVAGMTNSNGTGQFTIPVTVANNSTTTFYGQSQDVGVGTYSLCSTIGITYIHDNVAPLPPLLVGSAPGSPSNSTTPQITGTTEPLASVAVFTTSDCSGPPAGIGTATAAGAFSVPVAIAGTTTFHAIATDAATNVSACSSSSFTFVYDNVAPAIPVITNTNPVSPSITSNTPGVFGTAESGATVRLYRSADCSGAEAASTVASGGVFGVGVTVPSNSSTPLSVTATDPAGNVSGCSSSITYVHDNLAPATPIITTSTPASPSSSNTPAISGTSEPGTSVRLFTNATCTVQIGTTVIADGSGMFSIDVTVASNSSTSFYARATDIATNVSPCSSPFPYNEDSIAPVAPTLNALPASSTNTTPMLTGSAEGNNAIAIYANATCSGAVFAVGTASGAGAFSIGATVTPNTSTIFSATSTDAAGNVSACSAPMTYIHDNISPIAPSGLTTTPVSPAGSNTPSVNGNAETGSTVRLFTNPTCSTGVAGTTIATAGGMFSVGLTVASGSTTTFYATTTDVAGNVSPCSSSFVTYTQDATAPATPTGLATTPASPSSSATPSVTGTTEANANVRLFTSATCTGAPAFVGTANGIGAFTIPITVAANSTTTFYADATDAAANTSPCSPTSVTYVQDSIVPAAPDLAATTPASPANANGPAITGTAEAAATVRIYTSATCTSGLAGTGVADAGGAFSISVAVGDNTMTTFYATATDAAGNASACSSGRQYVEDSLAPATPNNLSTTPASPIHDTNPSITGNAETGSTVSIYTSVTCTGAPVGTGTAAANAFAIFVSVAANTTTTFYARAVDAAGNQSSCSSPVTYIEDSTAPALPVLTSTTPASPAANGNPTVTGTAEASATVKIYAGACATLLATGTATPGGTFSIVTPVPVNATTTLRATATDAATNVSGCSTTSLTYTHDAIVPALPAGLAISPASPANENNPVVTGTAEAGTTVTLYTNATCTTLAGASGIATGGGFSISVPVLNNTSYTFYATATDLAGNVSGCSISNAPYTEDSAAPAAPTGLATNPVSPSSSNAPLITGTAEAGSTVRIYSNAACTTLVATGSAAAFAAPGITATVPSDSTTVFRATATDAAGNVSGCSVSTATYVEDSTPPAVPIISGTSPTSPSNNNSPTVQGTAEVASTVRVYSNAGCTTLVGTGIATGGNFGIAVTAVASNSTTTYFATATDAAGNASACTASPVTYVEDSNAPTVSGLTTTPTSGANNNNPTINGTAELGASVVAYSEATCTTVAGSTIAGAGGAFGITVTVADNTTTTFYVRATDAANNSSACGAATITYMEDSTAVDVPILVSTTPASPSGSSTTPTITGTAGPNLTIKVYTNAACTGVPITTLSSGLTGNFTTSAIAVVANSTTTFYATATLVSTSACSSGLVYVHDNVAPAAPAGLAAVPASPSNSNTPTISGTAEASSTVKLYTNATCTGATLGSGPATAGGFSIVTSALASNATTTIYATATDAAGNISACSASNVVYVEDSAAPAAPMLTSTTPASPASASTAPSINGTAEAGATVRIYATSDCSGATAGIGVAGGGAFSVAVTVGANSSTTFKATATDAAGNASACSASSITYVHDNQAPAAPTSLAVAPVSPANNNNPTVSGSAEAGTTVTLYTNATCTSVAAGSGTAGGGTFAIVVPGGIVGNDSATTFYAKATDAAGNASACSTSNAVYVEDSTAPAAPAITSTTPASPSKSVTTPAINGTAEAGSTVSLYTAAACGGGVLATGPATGGAFSISVTVAANSTTTLFARTTDAAGNQSACSAAGFLYVHDSVAPTTPASLALAPASPADNNAPSITGSAEANATINVYTNAGCTTLSASGTATAGGAFSVPLSVADNTTTTFFTKAIDQAGNASACSAGVTYIEDSTTPNVPVVSGTSPVSPSNSSTTPTVTGTAEAGATVTIYGSSSCSGGSLGSGPATGGNFSIGVTVTANTATTLYATATDSAGHTSGCSATFATYIHDNIAPATPGSLATTPGSPSNATSATVSGTGETGATINIYFTNNCSGGVKASPAAAAGTWTTASLSFTTNTTTPITARAVDAAGNQSACSAVLNFTQDAVAPATPSIASASPASPSNVNTPFINGTAEAGATVTLYTSSACTTPAYTGVATGGAFSIQITVGDNTSTSLYARATDAAGNSSGCTASAFVYLEDSTAPSTPTIGATNPTSPSGNNTPQVLGSTSEPGAQIKLFTNASCTGASIGSGTSGVGGTFSITATVPSDVTTFIFAQATDPAGNASACMVSGFQYREDSTPPSAPSGLAMVPNSPANNNKPDITGTAENGAIVNVYAGNSCGGASLGFDTSNGTFSASTGALADNSTNTFSLQATDAAGNVSACSAAITYIEDSLANAPIVATSTPTSPSATSTTPTINGTSEANSTVTIYATPACNGTVYATGTASGTGSFSLAVNVNANSSTTFYAQMRDVAGNTSACSSTSVTYVHDSTGPTFGGPTSALATSTTTIRVSWASATDNFTSAANMRYDLCASGTPNGCAVFTVTQTSAAGATFLDVSGLGASQRWWFRVRAVDQVGNIGTSPVEVTDRTFGAGSTSQVAAGLRFACALGSNGHVACWGDNTYGQLGDGSNTQRLAPTNVTGLVDVVQISAGGVDSTGHQHACAVKSNGEVWCWGANQYGELGNGLGPTPSNVPVQVSGISKATQVSAGGVFSCATLSNGTVKCWGLGAQGELGDGLSTNSTVPVTVSGISSAVAVEAGYFHACALLTDGSVRCWGADDVGQLGNGAAGSSATPSTVSLTAGEKAKALDVAGYHACVLIQNGEVRCWGANEAGQLGNNTLVNAISPVPALLGASNLNNVIAISAGGDYTTSAQHYGTTCAVRATGVVRCWGYNASGQVGNNTTANALTSAAVTNASNAARVSVGAEHACSLSASGTLTCWGNGGSGRLGNGLTTNQLIPVAVTNLTSTESGTNIEAGATSTCARMSNGEIHCWGANGSGELGNDGASALPYPLAPVTDGSFILSNFTDLDVGGYISAHACAVRSTGGVMCWGANGSGQLGDSSTTDRTHAVAVSGVVNAVAVATGGSHSCAAIADGTVQCWGSNGYGQLGNGTTTGSLVPVLVTGITSAVDVTAGYLTSCALLADGTVKCWGYNGSGQIGNGNTTSQSLPTAVTGLTNARRLIESWYTTCAILYDGSMKCWGAGDRGTLGNGGVAGSSTPVVVSGTGDYVVLGAGGQHVCGTKLGNSLAWCWGMNNDYGGSGGGQVGNNSTINQLTPVLATGLDTTTDITGGDYHTCSLHSDGTAECWGMGNGGQLGDGSTSVHNLLVPSTVRYFP